jgi:hypothetical protein
MMRHHHHGPCRDDAAPSREDRLRLVEEYRQDLEQELADVSERIVELETEAEASVES